jgi:hypothetical protein
MTLRPNECMNDTTRVTAQTHSTDCPSGTVCPPRGITLSFYYLIDEFQTNGLACVWEDISRKDEGMYVYRIMSH